MGHSTCVTVLRTDPLTGACTLPLSCGWLWMWKLSLTPELTDTQNQKRIGNVMMRAPSKSWSNQVTLCTEWENGTTKCCFGRWRVSWYENVVEMSSWESPEWKTRGPWRIGKNLTGGEGLRTEKGRKEGSIFDVLLIVQGEYWSLGKTNPKQKGTGVSERRPIWDDWSIGSIPWIQIQY